jgi:hypothetical protein
MMTKSKMTIGELWSRYIDLSNWREDGSWRFLQIDRYVIATGKFIDGWKWSIYCGKAEWYSHYVEPTWSPLDYADENEARAAAWSTFLKIVAGPGWPPEWAETAADVFSYPDEPEYQAG